jgi:hypothetical protein
MMKKPVQVQDYEKDKDEDEGEVILTSLMGVPVRCKAISGMCRQSSTTRRFCFGSLAMYRALAEPPLVAAKSVD